MKEVKIEIERTDLADMDIEQPIAYAPFRFKESAFIGYWISKNAVSGRESVIFYVGSQTFVCKNTAYNVELFESMLR